MLKMIVYDELGGIKEKIIITSIHLS